MSQFKIKTRKSFKCPVFGYASSLPTNVLPTYTDVMRHYHQIKQTLEAEGNLAPTVSQISSTCSFEIESLWAKASIPIVSHTRVLNMIRTFHDEFRAIMKPYKGRKNDKKYLEKLQIFRKKLAKNYSILQLVNAFQTVASVRNVPRFQKTNKSF
jgi:hypothetical protein